MLAPNLIRDWTRYKELVQTLPYGKILPAAIYVHRDTTVCRTGPLAEILNALVQLHGVGDEFNVLKLRTDAPRLSFLNYPAFFEDPHPALAEALAIDLSSGRSCRTEYRDSLNPPILHRKELLLPPDHPRVAEFAALSASEEQAGLYDNATVIGYRINWERLLAARGLMLDGHSLVRTDTVPSPDEIGAPQGVVVHRHRTALTRYQLSKPVKSILEFGQLAPGASFLDYGCGLGADVRGLRELGFDAVGWDPVHAPNGPRIEADVVNLGYVLNVIEDPAERLETLASAWRLARRLLVVSALIGDASAEALRAVALNDGILTRRSTFQRYFGQQELQLYLEDALETSAIPVALGIFYIFRDPNAQQLFLQSRSRRAIDWRSLSLGLNKPERQLRTLRPARADRFAEHQPLLEEFWCIVLPLGRIPLAAEFGKYSELCAIFGSAKRALRHLLNRGRQEVFDRAQASRRSDLLVYLAISNLRRAIPFMQLPASVRTDITTFFGNYKRALTQGREMLHSAADTNNIALACDETTLGWQDNRSLYVHTSMVDRLPTVLRTFIACAERLYGDIHEADIVRIHKYSGKVTFLSYADFESALFPSLAVRTRVNLRKIQVDVFDHSGDGQILYHKERFLDPENPQRSKLLSITDSLEQIGIPDSIFLGPKAPELRRICAEAGRADLFHGLGLVPAEGPIS
jgi:DNA phosphorothioation-associated putative methyltransferase